MDMYDSQHIEIGFTGLLKQANMTSHDIMQKALSDAAEILAVSEDEVIKKYRDVMLELARGATLDMAAGTIGVTIQVGAERIANAIEAIDIPSSLGGLPGEVFTDAIGDAMAVALGSAVDRFKNAVE
jgi:hypothetical protein